MTKESELRLKCQLKEQLSIGYTKKDLEMLIGLPANNLASFLLDKKCFSQKNLLRIERWLVSENKPDPLSIGVFKKQIKKNNLPENKVRIINDRIKVAMLPELPSQYPSPLEHCILNLNTSNLEIKPKEQPKTNYSINIKKKEDISRVKRQGESSIDYQLRMIEESEKDKVIFGVKKTQGGVCRHI